MLCPKCSYDNEDTNIRCEKCGEKLIVENQMQDIYSNKSFNIQQDQIKEAKIESFVKIISGIRNTIGGLVFSYFSFLAFKNANNIMKIIVIPFLICGIAVLIYGISILIKGINKKINTKDYINNKLDMNKVEKDEKVIEKVMRVANKIYIFGVLIFWFGFLIVFDILSIKFWSDGGSMMFLSSLIFWAVGIYILFTKFKK